MTKNVKSLHNKSSKGQRQEDLERQREARRQRNIAKKERKKEEGLYGSYGDGDFVSFRRQLNAFGYRIKDVMGDG